MKPTTQDLSLLRTNPQSSELRLSIYKPDVVISCMVNDSSISKGARIINYDTVTAGSYTDVVSNMTMLVGTSPGKYDLGKVRVRAVNATYFVVAENSDVKWANDAYLTVIKFFDIVSIFQRIVQLNPNNPEELTWYKDYDIAYTNQNSVMGSFICAGPHRAGNLVNGQASFYFSSSGTSHVGGDELTYYWAFPGSNITGSFLANPGYVTYNSPGHYVAYLTVSGTYTQSSDFTARYISVYPENEVQSKWSFEGLSGDRKSSGYTTSITLHESWKWGDIYDGSVVVIYGDSYYGTTQKNIGGNSQNNSQIFFVGYIMKNSIQYDYEKSTVTFDVASISDVMKTTNGFAISLEDEVSANTWYQITGLNLQKSVYHFLRWHSTVLLSNDFQFLADDRYIQFFDTSRESTYDSISNVLSSALMAELVCDRQGKLWVETSMEATNKAKTLYPPNYKINKIDWINQPSIENSPIEDTSYIEMGGIIYTSVPNKTSLAVLSAAPGVTPGIHGKVDSPNGLALVSQSQLNNLSGDVYAYRNSKIPNIQLDLSGDGKNFDIAPLETYVIEIQPQETAKNVYISGTYFPESLSYSYRSEYQRIYCQVTLREVTEGVPGDTIVVPDVPPVEPPVINVIGFDPPPIILPPPGGIVPPSPIPVYLNQMAVLFSGIGVMGLDGNTGQWYPAITTDTGWTGSDISSFYQFEVGSDGGIYLASSRAIWGGSLYNTSTRNVIAQDGFANDMGTNYQIQGIGMGKNPTDFGVLVGHEGSILGGSSIRTYLLGTDGKTLNAKYYLVDSHWWVLFGWVGNLTFYNDVWYMSGITDFSQTPKLGRFLPDLSGFYGTPSYVSFGGVYGGGIRHCHARASNYIYTTTSPNACMRVIPQTSSIPYTQLSVGANGNYRQSIDCDPTGQYVMVGGSSFSMSSNFGNTWGSTTFPSLSFDGRIPGDKTNFCVKNMGYPKSWVVSYNATAYLDPGNPFNPTPNCLHMWKTEDFGATWVSILGNLWTDPALYTTFKTASVAQIRNI